MGNQLSDFVDRYGATSISLLDAAINHSQSLSIDLDFFLDR
jgi:hypothetical protein